MAKAKKQKAAWGSSTNMWRDPKTTKKGGCLSVIALAGASGAAVVEVARLLG